MTESPMSKLLDHFGVHYRDSLRWQTIRCLDPKHDDQHGSARVNLDEDAYACLGCGLKGNSVRILMKVENVSEASAEARLQEITGGGYTGVSRAAAQRRRGPFVSDEGPRDFEGGSGIFQTGRRKGPFGGSRDVSE